MKIQLALIQLLKILKYDSEIFIKIRNNSLKILLTTAIKIC